MDCPYLKYIRSLHVQIVDYATYDIGYLHFVNDVLFCRFRSCNKILFHHFAHTTIYPIFTLKITLQLTFMNCHNLFSSLKSLNNLFDCSSNSCTPALPCLTKEGRLLPIQRPVSLCWM